jgi:hypothetical protein
MYVDKRTKGLVIFLALFLVSCSEFRSEEAIDLLWSVTSNPSEGLEVAMAVAVDQTSIYVVGWNESPKGKYNTQWRIEKRCLKDGSLIWAKTSNPSDGGDNAREVAIDQTGIYVVGRDEFPKGRFNHQWRIEKRSLKDGTLLWSVISNPSKKEDVACGVAVDQTGIYVVGYDSSQDNSQWRIEKRCLKDGSLIWAKTSNPSDGGDGANGVAIDQTGIYVVGYDSSQGDLQWRIEKRSLKDGSLLWSVISNPSDDGDQAWAVAIDQTGIYVVGDDSSRGDFNYQWRIEKRSLKDGSLIWVKRSNPSRRDDCVKGVCVDPSGVYVVGFDISRGRWNFQWRIEKRCLKDGSLIWVKRSNPTEGPDLAYGVAVDQTGIYVIGCEEFQDNLQWRIEKYTKKTTNSREVEPKI